MYLSESTSSTDTVQMRILHGKGNKRGGAVGKLVPLNVRGGDELISTELSQNGESEQERYASAQARCADELRRIYGELRSEYDCAWIFLMQSTLLGDSLFSELAKLYISEGKSAEDAVILCRKYFFDVLLSSDGGENLREVSLDVYDLSLRLLSCLSKERHSNDTLSLYRPSILVCKLPLPSLIIASRQNVVGIVVTDGGNFPSAKEIASDLDIPYVTIEAEMADEYSEKSAIIDSDKGYLYVDPDLMTLAHFSDVEERRRNEEKRQNELANKATVTKDGRHLLLLCEISGIHDLESVSSKGCDGIGKLPCEELYLESVSFPDEELLFEKYRQIAESMPTKPIMIRSFKTSGAVRVRSMIAENESESESEKESHGELYVINDSTLKVQLRALMRAAVYGNLHFVLPRSGDYTELASCAQIMEELSEELYEEDREYTPVPLGLVIDSVSAAIMCEKLIADCDFIIVDKEKLKASVFTQSDDDEFESGGYSVKADALDRLISHVFESVKKAKKKAILSLGKSVSRGDLARAIEYGFSTISVDSSCIVKAKRMIADTQEE